MGAHFSDITLYTPAPYKNGTPEYLEDTSLKNYVSDLYVQKMYGYKPPKITRIAIQPAYHDIWDRTWKNGSTVSIVPLYSHDQYVSLDRKGKYKYVLDIIQAATLQLSDEYNWDKAVFEKAYDQILANDFDFRIEYPKKISIDRQKTGQVIIEKTERITTLNLRLTVAVTFEKLNYLKTEIGSGMTLPMN